MGTSTRPRATIAGVLLALLGTLLAAPAAHAAETRTISTKPSAGPPGHAVTRVTVRFPSKRAIDIKGWVKDSCGGDSSGDGNGASARVIVGLRGDRQYRRQVGKDINGCGNGKRHYDPAPKRFDVKIKNLTMVVCETDADTDYGICYTKSFDNWRID